MSERRAVMILAGLLFGALLSWSSGARAQCTGPWSWSSDNGYSGTYGSGGAPADVAASYLAANGLIAFGSVTVSNGGTTFMFAGGHSYAQVAEYVYTFTGSACAADPAASAASNAPGTMGSYSANVGLYVFVVGVVGVFGLGVIAGGKR